MDNCPSPENPCMCRCHLDAKQGLVFYDDGSCYECRMGRHKPKLSPQDKVVKE